MRFDNIIEEMRNDIISTTQELIQMKSLEGQPEAGAPFGRDMRKCLDRTLEICEKMGFKTKNLDGYAGHAEYGEGEEMMGILVHLDVVPEGSGWSVEPYSGEVIDGKLFGRGAIDDKGPAVAAMYALKAVKDSSEKINKKIRIIFGCDEETGRWDCMKHYFKHEQMPDFGFAPDADFPIIHSEKGIILFNLNSNFNKSEDECCCGIKIKHIKGGNRPNTVPDYCECELNIKEDIVNNINCVIEEMNGKENVKFETSVNGTKYIIKSFGVSAHGSTPEKGVNAIGNIIKLLCKLPLCNNEQSQYVNFINDHIGIETDGTSFGLYMCDEPSGKLVLNLGVIELDEEKASTGINIRYPVTKTKEEVYNIIREKISNTKIELFESNEKGPLYVPADNFLVKKLQMVYESITGEKAKLISIGGGTYARAIKNAVAFGPLFPGQPETAHEKDECIAVEDLIKCTKIYADAIYELTK